MFLPCSVVLIHVMFMSIQFVLGAPIPVRFAKSIVRQPTPASSTPSDAPHFVIYGNKFAGYYGPPPVDRLKGFNTYVLTFWQTDGIKDKALEWQQYTPEARAKTRDEYHAAGIKLLLGVFGDPDRPTSRAKGDPVAMAESIAQWVKEYGVDGVEINYEDFEAMGNESGVNWLIPFTKAMKEKLPEGQKILTHSPVAPWFDPNRGNNGYLRLHREVGNLIDYYNVQFYNQGPGGYTNCKSLLETSTNVAKTSVFEIAAGGVPLNKIVIGKPASTQDAGSGYMDPPTLAECFAQGKQKGWNGGLMVWQFGSIGNDWIQTVRSKSFPIS